MSSILTAPNSLADMLLQQSQSDIFNGMLSIATTLGLPVTSWQPGDPTRSTFYIESQFLESLETIVVGFIGSGFLDYAKGEWLNILALEQFGITVPAASFAESTLTLTNSGGGVFTFAPGDLTASCSATGATYHNLEGGTINAVGTSGASVTIDFIADVAGSAGSAPVNGIDTLVTSLLGVTITASTIATGTDSQAPATTIQQCRSMAAALSPNGPAAAYSFVALNSQLTGIQTVTRAQVYPDSVFGNVQIYVAGPSGGVSSGDVSAVQAAINKYATPLCITPTVASATADPINIVYTISVYQSVGQNTSQIEAAILTALQNLFAEQKIGGDIIPPATTGAMYASIIEATIGSVFPGETIFVTLVTPASDTPIPNSSVATLGSVTPTVNIIPNRP